MASEKWKSNEKRNLKEQLVNYPSLTRERGQKEINKKEKKNRKIKKKKGNVSDIFWRLLPFQTRDFLNKHEDYRITENLLDKSQT